jgi:hypothetical protein
MPFPNQGPLGAPNAGTDPSVTPYTNATVSVTSTVGGTSITTVPANTAPVYITNGATPIFLGNSGVTTTTGYPLAANAAVLVGYGWGSLLDADQPGGVSCQLFGITASGSSTVTYGVVTAFPGNE